MESNKIEHLVQCARERMSEELGEYPEILIHGNAKYMYDVQLCYSDHLEEHNEVIVTNLTEDELVHFLECDIDRFIRHFYYRIRNGKGLYDNTLCGFASWILSHGGCLIPTDVFVDIRWKDTGEVCKNVCVCCDPEMYNQQQADDFNPDKPLRNGRKDSDYFFYYRDIRDFFAHVFGLLSEDFEIIEVNDWALHVNKENK